MSTLSTLSFELIGLVAQYLNFKDLICLSQCNKTLYGVQRIDQLWKGLCRMEFGIQYHDPNQSYKQLFYSCCMTVKGKGEYKRLPCNHVRDAAQERTITKLNQCQRCGVQGDENLFLCISDNCHQISKRL